MNSNITMKIAGIEGESKVEGAEKEIDILHYGINLFAAPTHHRYMSGQGGLGKGELQPIPFTKYVDKATAQMMVCLLSGRPLGTVVITSRAQINGDNKVARTITLTDALLQSLNYSSDDGENFVIAFKKAEFVYTQYDDKGAQLGTTKATYALDSVKTSST